MLHATQRFGYLQGVMTHHMFTYVPHDGDPTNGIVYATQWLLPHSDGLERFQLLDGSLLMSP
jgi:hypothetical protein